MKVIDSQTWTDTQAAGTWDLYVFRGGQEFALPFVNPTGLAPITHNFNWHRDTESTPREMMDFEKTLVDIVNKYKATFDAAERKTLLTEYNNVFTENVYDMGVFIGRYGLGTAKRVNNIADGTPVFMYTWVEDAILLDQLWTPKAEQLPENRPDTIAVYPAS
jgi:peptide/nickel transport system substrate-binding protein